MTFTVRICCLMIGYCFGIFQTGYFFGKWKGIDIRKSGSGNSGTTNALRVMGKKAGAVVFLGDVLKVALACLVTVWLFNNGQLHQGRGPLIVLYTGFGCILGHNFPFYLGFKGGKGVACTACLLLLLDWRMTLIEAVLFLAVVIITRFVSLGSILVMIFFACLWPILFRLGWIGLDTSLFTESMALVVLLALLGIYQHRTNIQRLLSGSENKLF